ncbi:hypothetical protein K2173_024599 [Erythroxylum novogranatense]|uniref:Acyl-coenzyme A thioesterase 13 n=1 Tax=Erythroxylum novogranatense TaxID=1862640 RepID=A0AAV8SUR2_9ROSI|nr:hypothetical protein K2173_024599 [Erythroxylum novogranatense]
MADSRPKHLLESFATMADDHPLDALCIQGLKVVDSQKGFLRCSFIVPDRISDAEGNWHAGAMATLIDDVGAAAVFSTGKPSVSVDFNISFLSTAKVQEEVEIEAKVTGEEGRLTLVAVEVRRKNGGQLVALAKQWMRAHNHSKF